jgi:hypothetical protein
VRNTEELNEELVSEERDDLSFVWEAVKALPVKYREVISPVLSGRIPDGGNCFDSA